MDPRTVVAGQLEMEWWLWFLLIPGKFSMSFFYPNCVSCEQKKREQQQGEISNRDFLGWFVCNEEDCYNHEGSSQVSLILF